MHIRTIRTLLQYYTIRLYIFWIAEELSEACGFIKKVRECHFSTPCFANKGIMHQHYG